MLPVGLFEGAAWSIALEPAAQAEVVLLVRMLLDLRDDVVRARGPHHPPVTTSGTS